MKTINLINLDELFNFTWDISDVVIRYYSNGKHTLEQINKKLMVEHDVDFVRESLNNDEPEDKTILETKHNGSSCKNNLPNNQKEISIADLISLVYIYIDHFCSFMEKQFQYSNMYKEWANEKADNWIHRTITIDNPDEETKEQMLSMTNLINVLSRVYLHLFREHSYMLAYFMFVQTYISDFRKMMFPEMEETDFEEKIQPDVSTQKNRDLLELYRSRNRNKRFHQTEGASIL